MLFICRYCWNVATYKLKVRNEKIEVISFVCRSDSFLAVLAVNVLVEGKVFFQVINGPVQYSLMG